MNYKLSVFTEHQDSIPFTIVNNDPILVIQDKNHLIKIIAKTLYNNKDYYLLFKHYDYDGPISFENSMRQKEEMNYDDEQQILDFVKAQHHIFLVQQGTGQNFIRTWISLLPSDRHCCLYDDEEIIKYIKDSMINNEYYYDIKEL